MALVGNEPGYSQALNTTPPLSTDGSDGTVLTTTTDYSVSTECSLLNLSRFDGHDTDSDSVSTTSSRHRRYQLSEPKTQAHQSAQALNDLRTRFDILADDPLPVTIQDQLANFRSGQEEVQLWLGATTVALTSLEMGDLGSSADLEGTAALLVSVNKFTLQVQGLMELGGTVKRRLRLESNDEPAADAIERDCTELEQGWCDLRDRVHRVRHLAVEGYERDQETANMVRALDMEVTRLLGTTNVNRAVLDGFRVRMQELEKRMTQVPLIDERLRTKLNARLRSVRQALQGAQASADRRRDTFSAVAGQLSDLLQTLKAVSTRSLQSLKDCKDQFQSDPTRTAAGMPEEVRQRLSEFQSKRKHYIPAVEKLMQLLSNNAMAAKEARAPSNEMEDTEDTEDQAVMGRYADVEKTWEQVQEVMWEVETLQQELEEMEDRAKKGPIVDEEETTSDFPTGSTTGGRSQREASPRPSGLPRPSTSISRIPRPATPSYHNQTPAPSDSGAGPNPGLARRHPLARIRPLTPDVNGTLSSQRSMSPQPGALRRGLSSPSTMRRPSSGIQLRASNDASEHRSQPSSPIARSFGSAAARSPRLHDAKDRRASTGDKIGSPVGKGKSMFGQRSISAPRGRQSVVMDDYEDPSATTTRHTSDSLPGSATNYNISRAAPTRTSATARYYAPGKNAVGSPVAKAKQITRHG